MNIIKKTPSINENELLAQEKYFKCQFPEDYKKFLLDYNGGTPDKTLIYFESDEGVITYFLGICNDSIYGIRNINNRFINRIPTNTLPIARDPGGNLFLMSIRGDDYGSVYFWDHEEEVYEDEEPDYSNMTLVAKSFTELVNNLKDISELDDK